MDILKVRNLPKQDKNGKKLDTSFRNMINFTLALEDEGLNQAEKQVQGIRLLYNEPQYSFDEIEGLLWFFSCGKDEEERTQNAANSNIESEIIIDFEVDADAIYSSFLQAYNIRLTGSDMHWWEFNTLLYGLPETTSMGHRMMYRSIDLSQIEDKDHRKHVQRVKESVSVESIRLMKYSEEERIRISTENAKAKQERWAENIRRIQQEGGN